MRSLANSGSRLAKQSHFQSRPALTITNWLTNTGRVHLRSLTFAAHSTRLHLPEIQRRVANSAEQPASKDRLLTKDRGFAREDDENRLSYLLRPGLVLRLSQGRCIHKVRMVVAPKFDVPQADSKLPGRRV